MDAISLMIQSCGRCGSTSSNAGIVYFTVTALMTNSGLNASISSSVEKRCVLYVKRIRFGSFSYTAVSWSKLSRSRKKLPIFPAPRTNIFILSNCLCLFLVYDLHLLADTLFVHSFEYLSHKVGIHTAQGTLSPPFVENLTVTCCLQHRHVVFFLILTDLTAHTHTFCQKVHQLVIKFVDLFTQQYDTFRRHRLTTNHQ